MRSTRLRSQSQPRVRLTSEEIASLQEAANWPMRRTIPNAQIDRLIEVGYIREVVARSGGISALALTGAGLRRLQLGRK
jgi:hypothetical protein